MSKQQRHRSTAVAVKSWWVPVVISIIVALIATAWAIYSPLQELTTAIDLTQKENESASIDQEIVSAELPDIMDGTESFVYNKYESELVSITTQKLLSPSADPSVCPKPASIGERMHVEKVMGDTKRLQEQNQVFVLLNGENEGILVSWQLADECLYEIATFAAQQLGADVDHLANGVKLMSQLGLPITTTDELHTLRITHVLLSFQLWVWPGIRVGHVYNVDSFKITTVSLIPKVFTVKGFFAQEEADVIIAQGSAQLRRSRVENPDAVAGRHAARTSESAFLDDNQFTRDLRVRTTSLARLPSPSFAERIQLVRYETGQFFRKHEDFFAAKEFLPPKYRHYAVEDYEAWTKWAAARIDTFLKEKNDQHSLQIPEEFRAGGTLYPNADDREAFESALLQVFMDNVADTSFFQEHADLDWQRWLIENLANQARDMIRPLLQHRGYLLPHLIKAWEKRIGLQELQSYKIPKRPISGITHYFHWIRWAKERIQHVLDTDPNAVPMSIRPEGTDYPTFHLRFQNQLLRYVLKDNTAKQKRKQLQKELGQHYFWMKANKNVQEVLLEVLRSHPIFFDYVVESWTKRAGDLFNYTKPQYVPHFEPNRFATVFLYLNDCLKGGETVFPYSKERWVTNIQREGMQECSEGLAVPPIKLMATMFYSQTPLNELDRASLHGGCPPAEGIKYGANAFTWNADADEGANLWSMAGDLKAQSY